MRKRRKKFTWFPTLGEEFQESPSTSFWSQDDLINPQDTLIQAIPVLNDVTQSIESQAQSSLRDEVEGQEYLIERIVGRIWGSVTQDPTSDNAWLIAIACFALAVCPVDADGNLALGFNDIDPLLASNVDKSYIVRRTSTLWNNVQAENGLGPTNIQNDGPDYGLIDSRSVRRVRRNERLFAIWSLNFVENLGTAGEVFFPHGFDLRVLGAMRKAKGDSTLR